MVRLILVCWFACWICAPSCSHAQGVTAQATEGVGETDLKISIGISNTWKLGHATPLRIQMSDSLSENARTVRVVSVDGDGVEVQYELEISDEIGSELWLPVQIGRSDFVLRAEVLGPTDNTLAVASVPTADTKVLSSDQPLVLVIGAAAGLEQLQLKNAQTGASNFSIVSITDVSQLPPTWEQYAGVDLLVCSTADSELTKQLEKRWSALDLWIRSGGGAIVMLSAETQRNAPVAMEGLQAWLPGPIRGTGSIANPAVLEAVVNTDDPLGRFDAVLLENERGAVEIAFSDTLARETAWWTYMARGHGTIRVVASDLGADAFSNWDDRRQLWKRLLEPYLAVGALESREEKMAQSGNTSYLGYDDMVGQLRATLDVFPASGGIAFSQLAGILIGILLVVGPLDYLLSVHWLNRPSLSWYFSGLVLVGSSIGLGVFSVLSRPDEVLVNTVQVMDVNMDEGGAFYSTWTHVYSGKARKLNVAAQTDDEAVGLQWQGLPGTGLGGLNTQLSTTPGMPAYRIHAELTRDSRVNLDTDSDRTVVAGARLLGVGVPAGGTQCLHSNSYSDLEVNAESNLRELPGVDQLEGEFTNPFGEDIKEAVLFYHQWYYRLNSRIPAGSTVVIASNTIPKDLTRKLNERRAVSEKVSSVKWDPSDRGALDRLMELMMFYKAASGKNYTGLKNRYQPRVDQSNLLATNQAILIGRLENPRVRIDVTDPDGEDLAVRQELDETWCRLVIPVARPQARR